MHRMMQINSKTYFNDAQATISRYQPHWHEKIGDRRIPLRYCRRKIGKQKNVCNGGFPKIERLSTGTKVICPGVARKHGFRSSGRRNAVGDIMGKPACEWYSQCCHLHAIVWRTNTHNKPHLRLPIIPGTHDQECKHTCNSTSHGANGRLRWRVYQQEAKK